MKKIEGNHGKSSFDFQPLLDSDNDGLTDDIDDDDDNDGIPDIFESRCETSTPYGSPSATLLSSNHVTSLYSDYNSFWSSSTGAINTQAIDDFSTLLAFKVGTKTYATGVTDGAMFDSDANGYLDLMDTNGDGIGDLTVEETLWTALKPVTKIKSGIRLEARSIDGNTSSAVGPLLTSGGLPFNPYLYAGQRGLDMAYAIANIGNSWYFRLGGSNLAAYGDGIMDILLTQGAQLGGGSNYNRVHLLDEDGNYLGNGVEVNWNNVPVVGYSMVDQYNADDSVSGRNQRKAIRFAAVELSEFGLTPAEMDKAVIFRLEISANADPIFFAVNEESFVTSCPALDTDGDGIPNSIDLDSDNDGIFDAVEAGHGQNLVDGRVTGPVSNDGVPDNVQVASQKNNGTIDYELKDSDNDNILDFLSLDSDSDGCNDVLEAGFTDVDDDGFLGSGILSIDSSGLVTGQGGYTDPDDLDANGTPDFRETGSAPNITVQPHDTVIFDGSTGTFAVTSGNTSSYQWQISTNGGVDFSDLVDSAEYIGTDTASLQVKGASLSMNGYMYRVILYNDGFACSTPIVSENLLLAVKVGTVITNKRITYRVKKSNP
ncbi:hypothetical protein HPE56_19715 [Maribacter sp. ANRC-HE7]|uniref:Thrombospondin type 3 repeat-containing protein n=1 Tax=Maribacter aquimaris TaxID=2737171 RepID=A0ABR7VA63_9FLAO|nr:hypothetical protein [Maribacter aquimaris]MBD0780033.1 hypothetical protein [Maribacter aquimaris]